MIKQFIGLLFAGVLFASPILGANQIKSEQDSTIRKWYYPDAVKIQYAGNIGFMAGGISYDVSNWYQLAIMYGMASDHSEAKTLNTVAFKNTFLVKKFHAGNFIITPTAGISVNLGSTHNTFRNLPDQYPDGYYFQNKIHVAPFFGAMVYHPLPFKTIKGVDLYTEIGTMDNYLLEAIRTDYVKLNEIWNLALGLTFYF